MLPVDEKVLLQRIASGNEAAFQMLYNRYSKKVYAHALRILQTEAMAEEAVQEIFLKVWLMGQKLKTIDRFDSYLKVLVRNHCLNHIRRAVLEREASDYLSIHYEEQHNETEEAILLRDTRRFLEAAIQTLPPQQRTVYQLCHQEGLKYEEAAQRLDISVNTVKTYMKRALASIREHMQEHGRITAILILLKIF